MSFFIYFSIQILKHHVFKLSLNIIEEKIHVIRQMNFFINFKKLKIKLNFLNYYKFFVNHFVNIVKSLVQLKTRNFKNASIKNRFKKKHSNKTRFDSIDQNQNLDFNIASSTNNALSTNVTMSKNITFSSIALSTKIALSTIFALSTNITLSTILLTNVTLSTTFKCFKTWKKFKKKFCIAFTLAYSNFSKFFILYVDDNKKKIQRRVTSNR